MSTTFQELLSGAYCELAPKRCACGELVLVELGVRLTDPQDPAYWCWGREFQYHDQANPLIVHECDDYDAYRELSMAHMLAIFRSEVDRRALKQLIDERRGVRQETPPARSQGPQNRYSDEI